jgi:multidrug efflux pump
MPMLSGTLVTVAGFLPIATAASSTGEYTRSIFQVTAIALAVSWVAAVVFVPYLGYQLLPDRAHGTAKPSWLRRLVARFAPRFAPAPPRELPPGVDREHAIYATPFYRRLRRVIGWCVDHRRTVLVATAALFVLSVLAFRFVPQQFFPASSRPELMIDLRLPQGSSFAATEAVVKRFERTLDDEPAIESYVS